MKVKQLVIEVDEAEARRKLAELPVRRWEHVRQWKPWEDKLLLEYWPTKPHTEIARILKVDRSTALKRYRELTCERR